MPRMPIAPRPEESAARRNNFDLLRLCAALQVMINHIDEHLHLPIFRAGAFLLELFPGVAIFFIISGYLIFRSYVFKQRQIWTFFKNRILRIFPGFIVSVIVTDLFLYCVGGFHLADIISSRFVLFHLIEIPLCSSWFAGFLMNGYPFTFPSAIGGFYPNNVYWTLTVEMGFYALVPILLWPLRMVQPRNGVLLWLLFWVLVSFACAVWMDSAIGTTGRGVEAAILTSLVFPYLWIFLLGGMLFLISGPIKSLIEGTIKQGAAQSMDAGLTVGWAFSACLVPRQEYIIPETNWLEEQI